MVPLVANRVLTVMIDNTSVVGMCRRQSAKMRRPPLATLHPLMREMALLCAAYGFTIRALPISTEDNTMVDLLSRARAPDVTPELLHSTLGIWSAREPDTTQWQPQPATYEFLVPLIERGRAGLTFSPTFRSRVQFRLQAHAYLLTCLTN